MSKSKGNIVYADDLVEEFGVDAVRYYMLHEIPFSSDGVFTRKLLIESINSNLANVLGNLVNRTVNMCKKYFNGIVENKNVTENIDNDLISIVLSTRDKVKNKMDSLRISDALDDIFEIYRRCNKYIDETTPWLLAKDELKKDRLATVLYNLIESIRYTTVLLQAFMPNTAQNIFKQLNTKEVTYDTLDKFGYYVSGSMVNDPIPLFMRIEKE